MNDCTNAEIRDQLPDLLHDRLTVSVREVVVAHVADCADCREELELLRDMHGALLSRTPSVNIGQIVASLPSAARGNAARGTVTSITAAPSRRFMRVDWRIAAAVTFLAVGGSSMALLQRTPSANRVFPDTSIVAAVQSPATSGSAGAAASSAAVSAMPSSSTGTAPVAAQAPVDSGAAAPVTQVASSGNAATVDDQAAADVSPGGRFAGLTNAQLQALINDIGQLPDVPVTEPDPVSIEVNTTSDGPGGL